MQIAKLMKHRWEEEPISGIGRGYDGTFAIFFYGCTMRCVYCQNSKISRGVVGAKFGEPEKTNYTPEELSDEIIKAQSENVASISFITGALYVDQIVETIKLAKKKGLKLPVVYNSSGYETAAQIKKLDGLVDIYLPDFKYFDNELGKKYSGVPNYADVAKECIAEMHRQISTLRKVKHNEPDLRSCNSCVQSKREFANCRGEHAPERATFERMRRKCDKVPLGDEPELRSCNSRVQNRRGELCEPELRSCNLRVQNRRGELCEPSLIIRHLVLPTNTENSKAVIKYLYNTYGNDIYLSIMSQYTPMPHNENIDKFPELLRKVTKREYEKVVKYAIDLGVKNAFIQEGDVASESFIPEFR